MNNLSQDNARKHFPGDEDEFMGKMVEMESVLQFLVVLAQ